MPDLIRHPCPGLPPSEAGPSRSEGLGEHENDDHRDRQQLVDVRGVDDAVVEGYPQLRRDPALLRCLLERHTKATAPWKEDPSDKRKEAENQEQRHQEPVGACTLQKPEYRLAFGPGREQSCQYDCRGTRYHHCPFEPPR